MFFEQSNTLAGSENTFEGLAGDMETMDGIDWNNIINQAFGVGSQAISAFSGRNSGTQIGYNPASQSVFAIQASNTRGFDETPIYYAQGQQQAGYGPQGVGGTVGSGVDGIFNWLMSNPLITFGGIAGLYLLFKEPPRRR